jgi:hypothetical protein
MRFDGTVNITTKKTVEEGNTALQRQTAENLKHIFPEKEYRGLRPNFHIHVSVSDIYSHDGSGCFAGGNM